MTIARRLIVNPHEAGWYHCVSRCVRRAYLCGDGFEHRKSWVVDRLKLLAQCFAVDIAAYAVMSNHLHVVVRVDPGAPQTWSAETVAAHWLTAFPRRHLLDGTPQAPSREEITAVARDWSWISTRRQRLGELGWFMKALKEPIARRANREDQVTGHFWEGRFRSTALLDEAAVIACMAYVDLNPIRARMATTPETSAHTSIQVRIDARNYHAARQHQGLTSVRTPARARSLFARLDPQAEPAHAEDGLWLWRFERQPGDIRAVMTAQTYLTLVDTTGRLIRSDKRGAIPKLLSGVLARLDLDVAAWITAMASGRQMRGTGVGHLTEPTI